MNSEFLVKKIRDEVIIQLNPVKGKTAADIGADTGFMSEALIDAGLNVIALDSSPEAIDFLKEKFRDIREFKAILTDPDKLNISDETSDYVCAYLCMQRTDYPEEQVREMFRILKHSGKAVVIDILESTIRESAPGSNGKLKGFAFPDIYAWFINAGFRNISIEKPDHGIKYTEPSGADKIYDFFIAAGEK